MISRQASVLFTLISLPLLVELGCESENMDVANPAVTGAGAGVTSAQGGAAAGGSDAGGTSASGGSSSGGTSAAGGAGAGGNIPPPPTEEVKCLNKLYDCGDLQDNDGDGLIDYQDPDCLGPCDNTEDSLFPDLPGDDGQKCGLDCFWDTGQGHDWNCYWDHQCDPLSLPANQPTTPQAECEFEPDANMPGTPAEQQANSSYPSMPNTCGELFALNPGQDVECTNKCLPLAPNGCDCFGCCEIAGQTVWLGTLDTDDEGAGGAGGAPLGQGTCTLESVGTPSFLEDCHPCTQVPSCLNDCGECELCLGKTELPPECFPPGTGGGGQGGAGGAPQDCPDGLDACGLPGQDPCGSNEYCITGCCVPIPQ